MRVMDPEATPGVLLKVSMSRPMEKAHNSMAHRSAPRRITSGRYT